MNIEKETLLNFLRELATELEEKCEDDWWDLISNTYINPDDFPLDEKIRRGCPTLSARLERTNELIQQLEEDANDESN